jgi:hypothetical protein
MRAGAERSDRLLGMECVRRADMDDVGLFGAEHRLDAVIGLADAEGLGGAERPPGDGYDLAAQFADQPRMDPRDIARSDDCSAHDHPPLLAD